MKCVAIVIVGAAVLLGCSQRPDDIRPEQTPGSELPPSAKFEIKLDETDLYINGTKLTLPVKPDTLVELLGKASRVVPTEVNTIWVWDDLGVLAYQPPNVDVAKSVNIALGPRDYEFWPKKVFQGTLTLDGAPITPGTTMQAINRKKKGRPLVRDSLLPFLSTISYDTTVVSIDREKNGEPDAAGDIVELSMEVVESHK